MLDLSNPGRLPLQDMPEDIAVGMFIAWRNGAAVEFWRHFVWVATGAPIWLRTNIYRIRPAKQLIAPWEWLAPWVKAVAMDADEDVRGFDVPPRPNAVCWVGTGNRSACLSHVMTFDTAGVDWRNSLTLRPEGK